MKKFFSFEGLEHKEQYLTYGLIALISLYLFFLSQNVPLFADDLCRHSDTFSLETIFNKVKYSYFYTAGRVPAMVLNYALFSSGSVGIFIISFLNAVALFFLSIFALKLIPNSRWALSFPFLVFFYFLFWFAPDTLGEDILWKTGAIQYFWGSVIAIMCIFPIFRYASYRENIISKTIAPFFLLGSFLGGMWLEHLSVAIFLMWSMVLLYLLIIEKIKVPTIFWTGLALWGLGMAILLGAPGNYARAARIGEAAAFFDKLNGLWPYVVGNIDQKYLFIYLLFFVSSALFDQHQLKRRVVLSLLFIMTGMLAAFATVGAPKVVYFGRVSFPTELFYVFGVMSLFPAKFQVGKSLLKFGWGLLLIPAIALSALLTIDMKNTYQSYLSLSKQEMHRHELIAESLKKGQTKIQLPRLYFNEHHTKGRELNWGRMFARDITIDSSKWPNPCYARVYGMEKVAL